MKPAQVHKQLPELARLFQSGRLAEARALGNRLLAVMPRQPQVLAILGAIHGQLGEFAQAEGCYRALAVHEPQSFQHHYYLALALVMQNRLNEALPHLAEVLRLKPDLAEAFQQMGCLLRDLGQHEQAIAHFRRALELSPRLADAAVFLGNLLVFRGELNKAMDCFERALAVNAIHPDALAGKALVLERQGARDAAWACLQSGIEAKRLTPNLAIAYALLAPKYGEGRQASTLINELLAYPTLAPSQKQELHFALGQLHDKLADYAAAFSHYQAGNNLNPLVFDQAAHLQRYARTKQTFPDAAMASVAEPALDMPTPIFVVGMPRSGTSLVEQILACHPEIAGAGELEALPEIEREMAAFLGCSEAYPDCLRGATAAAMAQLAGRYLAVLDAKAPGAKFVVDKLPGNYERLGLIEKLFPHAIVIHTTRDPYDTALSCYFQNFGNTHAYTSNFQALGCVYRSYRALMAHWRENLSIRLLEVSYEELVADTESVVRSMLEFCGVPWHAQCLEFHASRRYINTASYDQVRQPIYNKSVNRWKHYKPYLQDFLGSLE